MQLNGFIAKLPLNQAQRMIQDVVQPDLRKVWVGWAGEAQHLANDRINPRQLAAHKIHQVRILMLLEQQIEKGFSDYESVPDFVSDPGGEGSERGQAGKLGKGPVFSTV